MPAFSLLLAAIFLELIVGPLFGRSSAALAAAPIFAAVVLVAALAAVGVGRAALILCVPAVAAHLLTAWWDAPAPLLVATALRFVFLCYVLGVVIRHVTTSRHVTADTVAGAACAYLLLGMAWASLYLLVEFVQPGSFTIPSTWLMGAERRPQVALTYLSFGTLATVGAADITPTNPVAGCLCVAEALMGQLYLATMIAQLVANYVAQRPPAS